MPAGLFFSARYEPTLVQLVVTDVLPGDYNRNGVVDSPNYVLWRKTLGQATTSFSGADGDGNGTINENDYAVWRAHFGQTAMPGAGSGTAVPEPTSLLLLIMPLVAALARSARR